MDHRAVIVLRRALVEGTLHRPDEGMGIRWLSDVVRDTHAERRLGRAFVATPRQEYDLDARIALHRLLGERQSRHLRHLEVRDQDRRHVLDAFEKSAG